MKPHLPLRKMVRELRDHPSIRGKLDIAASTRTLGLTSQSDGQPGDDCAVLPSGDGFDLFSCEGFINAFVKTDPWFAGWCGVMVNISDILSMGGRPRAVTNAIWAPNAEQAQPVLAGMKAASQAYGVPVVGGHTNLHTDDLQLSVSILGHAKSLISSFDARPGDVLICAIDLRGSYREPFDNWNAALTTPPAKLREAMAILPSLAESGLVTAGKDISQGGILGTALMLAEASGVSMEIQLEALPKPVGVDLPRWLRSFPSFGFLLSARPENAQAVCAAFTRHGISAAACGDVSDGSAVQITEREGTALFWDYERTPYLNLSAKEASNA
ncbi:selenophosphate synthetase-related protein [Actibacterium atlanticum]|uniref:Selenophosphate synthetase-related protein n=1 Tax=Actibacterium atlanticum TaxID=1461693 RepID=A0A058ZP00_9RHOB|nr:sll0787 family AIR synthase-like protein [Actibacterium atlanticum]KCV83319.1 selenophosphate synthetase-related protein [Actibacterium atlanticum]